MIKKIRSLVSILMVMICIIGVCAKVKANEVLPEETNSMEFVSKSVETGEVTTYDVRGVTPRSGEMSTASFSGTEPEDRKIIGNDNRERVYSTTSFPYRAIAYLETYWPNGTTTVGTAWMISPDAAATAGHCVYDTRRGGWADNKFRSLGK